MAKIVALVVSDLLFRSRIADALNAAGCQPMDADDPESLARALAASPAAAVVDLHERNVDAKDAIARFRSAGVPVLAFGRHTEPQTLRAARDAGAGRVVPRSQLVEELPALLDELLGNASEPA